MSNSKGGAPSLVAAFRPRARLLQLLGDQLIGSPRLAIFELVKNAYDADARTVTVTMSDLAGADPSIEVRDDGSGMGLETLRDVWLVPGHDHKARQRQAGVRTELGRLPLGEKGVGRFAVHKLGNVVEVITKQEESPEEYVLRIDWNELTDTEFLADAAVTANSRPAETFRKGSSGTVVRVTSLRGERWTRGEVRRLSRQITSISSPFEDVNEDFRATLRCTDQSEWLTDLPDTRDLIAQAPWEFEFALDDGNFTWSYSYRGIRNIELEPRQVYEADQGLLLDPADLPDPDGANESAPGRSARRSPVTSTAGMQVGIGTIKGRFFVYDRDPEVLKRMSFSGTLKSFLDDTGGIRVYRDGIRVYNYGEPGDDWLGLDLRRVNAPSKRVSNNIVVGAIELDLSGSGGLAEKTNREGFVENPALHRFRALIRGVLAVFESERNKDKNAIRALLAKDRVNSLASIERPLQSIRRIAKRNGFDNEIEPFLRTAQNAFDEMRSISLRAGVSNMSIVLVYHEVEHGIRLLERNLAAGNAGGNALEQAKNLVSVIDGFGDILRSHKPGDYSLRSVVTRGIDLNAVRLRNHDILVETAVLGDESDTAVVSLSFGLVLGAITNLIDNSIYWLSARWPSHAEGSRRMYIGIDLETFAGRPAIVVADNGPGFRDDLGDLTEAFFTRRPNGLGVGLYYVNLIMHAVGGELRLLEPGNDAVPQAYDGAALALLFRRS